MDPDRLHPQVRDRLNEVKQLEAELRFEEGALRAEHYAAGYEGHGRLGEAGLFYNQASYCWGERTAASELPRDVRHTSRERAIVDANKAVTLFERSGWSSMVMDATRARQELMR